MPRTHVRREVSRRHATGSDGKAYVLVELIVVSAASYAVDGSHPPAVEVTRFELADGSTVDKADDGLWVVRSTGVALRCKA